jgi:argininosuccinate lyase
MSPRHFVDVRRTPGGPSPIETSRAIEQAGAALDADRAWLTRTRAALTAADERLRARSLGL